MCQGHVERLLKVQLERGGGGLLEVLLCPVERAGYFVNGNKVFQVPSA